MMIALLLMAQTAPAPVAPTDADKRLSACVDAVAADARQGESLALAWRAQGGGFRARRCLGVAYANQERWSAAASAFDDAAREAEIAHDAHAPDIWAQAGNAWLAAGDPAKARAALDAALASGGLTGLALGEAQLDRARARYAGHDAEGARADIDRALATDAANDPLAWLLSATLARLGSDLKRAKTDIDEALRRSPDDASIQLEAGNIAALAKDEPGARAAWARVVELAPGSDLAEKARAALAQFGAEQ